VLGNGRPHDLAPVRFARRFKVGPQSSIRLPQVTSNRRRWAEVELRTEV
jgi:hypothetical protein